MGLTEVIAMNSAEKYMSTPNTIFLLSHENPTIHRYLELWKHGEITWNKALLYMGQELQNQYMSIVIDNNLKECLEETRSSRNGRLPILEASLMPRLDEEFFGLSPLHRNSKVIEAIVLILEFHSYILNLVATKTKRELPKTIVENTDGLAITGGDRHE